jgi:uncharacterized protein (TIGR04255 family)
LNSDEVGKIGMGLTETNNRPKRTLPDFEEPPVVETALALKFAPIHGWNLLHFGKLLTRFERFYPKLQLQPAIGAEIQFKFDAEKMQLPIRCWFLTDDDSQLIQLQDDMFVRNWRKTQQISEYKHYEEIKPLFERDWDMFLSFLEEQRLPSPEVWQCEVTYINHLSRGREWEDFRDLSNIFPAWRGVPAEGLFERMDLAGFNVVFSLPHNSGKLSFAVQPAVRKSDGAEVIQFTVTALGRPTTSTRADILSWLDLGRAAVVNGFAQFTSPSAKTTWRIKE